MKKSLLLLTFLVYGFISYSQDYAISQLENSPRHHEWVDVTYGDRVVHCFVAYPETSEKTIAVIVIHENRGLNDWARSFTDQLAGAGFLAIAPDLLSDFDEKHKLTTDFATSDEARSAIYQLDPEQVTKDLSAVQSFAANIPACNGKTVVAGFCWGGSQSFRFATNNEQILAALVFYGSAPKNDSDYEKITAPVYGFYGGNDQRINAGIPNAESQMKANDNTYEYEIYEGAGHAYMRRGDDPNEKGDNKTARDQSWDRLLKILKELDH